MTDDDERDDNTPSFSDEDLEAAMADFEAEFRDADGNVDRDTAGRAGGEAPDGGQTKQAEQPTPDAGDVAAPDDASALTDSFDDELQGLLGNKAKAAVIVTQLASAELLAAFCQLSDVSATCIGDGRGAVAVLRNLDGDGPEAAARDLTTVVSGMSVILATNRADKLEATLYVKGKAGQGFAPPILFTQTPPFVEDLMLGIGDLDSIKAQGAPMIESASLDDKAAMAVIARHTRFGRGHSSIQ